MRLACMCPRRFGGNPNATFLVVHIEIVTDVRVVLHDFKSQTIVPGYFHRLNPMAVGKFDVYPESRRATVRL